MPKEPLSHIARAPLPWRAPADNDTECGKPVSEFASVISWDEAVELVKAHGQQRSAFLLCMTCLQTAPRHGWRVRDTHGVPAQMTFEDFPSDRIARDLGKRREQTDRELRALAELVTRHRQEFDDLMAGRIVPIADLRRAKNPSPRRDR